MKLAWTVMLAAAGCGGHHAPEPEPEQRPALIVRDAAAAPDAATDAAIDATVASVPPASPVAPFAVAGCPFYALVSAWWAHELFPGCPAMPFAIDPDGEVPAVCGADCPRPCRITIDDKARTIAYDPAGRWISIADSEAGDTVTCSYDGARMKQCKQIFRDDQSSLSLETAKRDAQGRLDEIDPTPEDRGPEPLSIRYDAHGRVAGIATGAWIHVELDYDKQGRLVAEHESERKDSDTVTYRYDQGRLVERRQRIMKTAYRYDKAGRLIAIEDRYAPGGQQKTQKIELAYDGLGRLVKETRLADGEPSGTRTFAYTCK